jgi:hypothetical protein
MLLVKRFLMAFAVAALLAGCSKSANTASDQATAAANAAATAAAAASAAGNAAATAVAAAATAAAAAAGVASGGDSTAATTASGAPFVPITLPVYPGATKEADKSLQMSSNGSSVTIDYYASSDSSDTVVAWYKAHLPSTWQNFTISSGAKTAGTFASPDHGNAGQSVVVTGEDKGGSQIQLSTKTGS